MDFGSSEQEMKLYKDWEWYSIICPDFTNYPGGGFELYGDISHMESKSFTFTINRCNPLNSICATTEEIDDFIKDI
jgi:hypothetical protein